MVSQARLMSPISTLFIRQCVYSLWSEVHPASYPNEDMPRQNLGLASLSTSCSSTGPLSLTVNRLPPPPPPLQPLSAADDDDVDDVIAASEEAESPTEEEEEPVRGDIGWTHSLHHMHSRLNHLHFCALSHMLSPRK